MEFSELKARALAVRTGYDKRNKLDDHKKWETAEYMQGFMGDVGDLAKLIMANNAYRSLKNKQNTREALTHELADCLWSIIVIADTLDIDLETGFINTMDEIIARDNLPV